MNENLEFDILHIFNIFKIFMDLAKSISMKNRDSDI